MKSFTGTPPLRYRIGIDVGTHSTGYFAAEVDSADYPIRVLNSVVYVHDSGVDPSAQKQASTRLAVAGVARRTRRMHREKKRRLKRLDEWIEQQGWPLVELETESDPYLPWLVRAELAAHPEANREELGRKLSIALRHMSRHRGWRNPYAQVRSLYLPAEPSEQYEAFRVRVEEKTGQMIPDGATPAQLVMRLGLDNKEKLRGPKGLLGGKLMQSDNANELRRIAEVQDLDDDLLKSMIDHVFAAKSPRGAAAGRTGKDALPGQEHLLRAAKADEEFQRFRIASVVANLRVSEDGAQRRLTGDEQRSVIGFLMHEAPLRDQATWDDIAGVLGVDRSDLKGTAKQGPDGERPSAFPPVNTTDRRMRELKVPAVRKWWEQADAEERAALVIELSNAGDEHENEEALEEVNALIVSLSDTDLEKLAGLSLPAGRAAYSRDSLRRLADRMLEDGLDLTEARMVEFGVPGDWLPPADPIGAPVGNPAVDRVTKQVARWLRAATSTWGTPISVNIEHVRSALGSEAVARELDRANNRRYQRNQEIFGQMQTQLGVGGKRRRSDLTRYLALQRQNCQCAYCGDPISFENAEMDHIVPRAGEGGARNTRDNLVAVCERCNKAKSNLPFSVWAESTTIPHVSVEEAIARVRQWIADPAETPRDRVRFANMVIDRLRRTSADDAIDDRSMESVAWMANELHSRIDHFFREGGHEVDVRVYRGAVTAEARKASGLEGRINLIGGRGKTRLDRRHHAVDAAVVSMLRPSVAKTLVQRSNLRVSQQMTRANETWKEYEGDSHSARALYKKWLEQMLILTELLNVELAEDAIPVMQNLRLRLANSRVHEETVKKFDRRVLSSELSATDIDRASTPALWTALTRLPDFDPKNGLPQDSHREIVVNGKRYGPLDAIDLFKTSAACIAVRGGYAELGGAVHHARVYRIEGKKPIYAMLRVYTVDLVRHAKEDLFAVELAPQTISMRTAEPRLRKGIREGTAEYIDWIVLGDEIRIPPESLTTGQVGTLLKEFPMIDAWRLDGFYTNSKLRLRPVLLAKEGLPDDAPPDIVNIIDRPGWRPSVNIVFGEPTGATVARRTTLGKERWNCDAGLPTSWTTAPEE